MGGEVSPIHQPHKPGGGGAHTAAARLLLLLLQLLLLHLLLLHLDGRGGRRQTGGRRREAGEALEGPLGGVGCGEGIERGDGEAGRLAPAHLTAVPAIGRALPRQPQNDRDRLSSGFAAGAVLLRESSRLWQLLGSRPDGVPRDRPVGQGRGAPPLRLHGGGAVSAVRCWTDRHVFAFSKRKQAFLAK